MTIHFLNKPLPAVGCNSGSLFKYFLVGVFVTLFLIVFQPFDINLWQTPYKFFKLAGFGAVSFLMPALYSFLLTLFVPAQVREDRWTVGKEIVSVIIVLVLIAFANMLYSNAIAIMHISFINFINALISVVLLGVFPVSFLVLSRHNRLFKRNTTEAQVVNEQLQTESPGTDSKPEIAETTVTENIELTAENEKDKLVLKATDLLYIESADNYSNVVFVENGKTKRQLIRSSLKRLESQVSHPFIVRCHRTYIVNLKNVIKVEGNAAGYKLQLGSDADAVPVSRGFGTEIIQKIKGF